MIRRLRQAILRSVLFILAPVARLYVCDGSYNFGKVHSEGSRHCKTKRQQNRKYLIALACFLIFIGVTLCVIKLVDTHLPVGCDIRSMIWSECRSSSFSYDNICRYGRLYLLIVVHSATGNQQRRQVLRDTWAGVASYKGVSLGHVFVIGQTTNKNMTIELEKEQRKFGDILRGDFIDSYQNLTRKMVSWMQWVDSYCPEVRFVMKCDDDVVVVPETAVDFIQDQMNSTQPVLMGNYAGNLKPHRDPKSKWLITHKQWKLPYLFQFHQGYAMLMSKQTLNLLNLAIKEERVEKRYNATWTNFPVDDAYLGILARVSGVKLVASPSFINVFELGKGEECDICDKVAILTESTKQMKMIWCAIKTMRGAKRQPFKTYDNPLRASLYQLPSQIIRGQLKKAFLRLFSQHSAH